MRTSSCSLDEIWGIHPALRWDRRVNRKNHSITILSSQPKRYALTAQIDDKDYSEAASLYSQALTLTVPVSGIQTVQVAKKLCMCFD
jgi:hypothetical protein